MARGSRHSKNAGTMGSEVMTYAERRALGYGTAHERFGKDSMGNFNDCRLTLQPAEDPVCTPWGVIYSKEAILQYFINQRREIDKRLDNWEKFNSKTKYDTASTLSTNESSMNQTKVHVTNTVNQNKKPRLPDDRQNLVSCGVNIEPNHTFMRRVKSFWGTNAIPEHESTASGSQEKPKTYTTCPLSGKRLRLKDLVPVKFTRARENNPQCLSGRKPIDFVDPITGDIFTNRSRLVCLRPTKDVVLFDTYKKFIMPNGSHNGCKIFETDVIELQKGGTGYVAHDGNMIRGSKHTYLGLGSGLADLRGQHSGSGAKAGLVVL